MLVQRELGTRASESAPILLPNEPERVSSSTFTLSVELAYLWHRSSSKELPNAYYRCPRHLCHPRCDTSKANMRIPFLGRRRKSIAALRSSAEEHGDGENDRGHYKTVSQLANECVLAPQVASRMGGSLTPWSRLQDCCSSGKVFIWCR